MKQEVELFVLGEKHCLSLDYLWHGSLCTVRIVDILPFVVENSAILLYLVQVDQFLSSKSYMQSRKGLIFGLIV